MGYTKVEWKVGEDNDVYLGREQSACIARVCGAPEGIDECVANAHLIAASPDLYEACRVQHDAIDFLFAKLIALDKNFFPSKSGQPWSAIIQGNKAVAKAENK